MCGRYQFTEPENARLRRVIRALKDKGEDWQPGDIFPSGKAPVLVAAEGRVYARVMKWGMPGVQRLIFNARAETAIKRPMFRSSFFSRRCVAPSTGFYEWDGAKRQYLFRMGKSDAVYLAGLYDRYDGEDCFVILTTQPNASVDEIHDRMPLVLEEKDVRGWLTEEETAKRLLEGRPPFLQRAVTDGQLSFL
ncbi:MAG: SOS response-associated peptidase [Oscillospiraceae bacterium]|nr:SOS response-associated peptidase [Oscillospiraceae bacterium]